MTQYVNSHLNGDTWQDVKRKSSKEVVSCTFIPSIVNVYCTVTTFLLQVRKEINPGCFSFHFFLSVFLSLSLSPPYLLPFLSSSFTLSFQSVLFPSRVFKIFNHIKIWNSISSCVNNYFLSNALVIVHSSS